MRALLLIVLALPLAASAQDLRPGRYRTTTTSDLAGFAGKPIVDEDCVTSKQVDEGLSTMGIEKDSNCKVTDMKRAPGKVSYRFTCEQDGARTSTTVTGTLGGDVFDFAFVMTGALEGGKPVRTRIVGKRVGECK